MATPSGQHSRPALPDALSALLAVMVAVTLVKVSPLRATLAIVGFLKRTTRRTARVSDARTAVAARDWAVRYFPGRAACMERSLAAFLVCRARGRAVDWCLGCRFDPCEAHAWIETEGEAIGEPVSPDRPLYVTIRV